MKNKKVLVVVATLALIVGIYGAYRIVKHFRPVQTQTQNPVAKTLKDLLAQGIAQKCTFDQGTVYVAGGKVRADFGVTADSKTTKSHMIVDGDTSYIWTEDSATGYKMTTNPNASPEAAPTAAPGALDVNKEADYVCGAWVTDASYFTLPKNIAFTDLSSMMNPSAAPATGNSQQCSYCDTLSGDAKASCLSALKCQ
jgi:hypothetical protein